MRPVLLSCVELMHDFYRQSCLQRCLFILLHFYSFFCIIWKWHSHILYFVFPLTDTFWLVCIVNLLPYNDINVFIVFQLCLLIRKPHHSMMKARSRAELLSLLVLQHMCDAAEVFLKLLHWYLLMVFVVRSCFFPWLKNFNRRPRVFSC